MPITALVVDDHPLCRAATAFALKGLDSSLLVEEASSVAEAQALAANAGIMTLDLGLPDNRGMMGLVGLRAAYPALPILVISGAENPATEREVARIGARGFVTKAAPLSTMVEALRTILDDRSWFSPDMATSDDDDFARLATLTPAQHRVLCAMENGRLNKQIAFDLGVSEITVKAHVKAILKKLGVVNRTQAVLLLRRATA